MTDEFGLIGFDEVMKKLKGLPEAMRGKAGRSALGSAARVVTNAAKKNAERIDDAATGREISDNVMQRFRTRYFRRTGDLMISVGVGAEKGRIPKGNPDTGPKGNTPHWHLVELGTEKAAAEPFMRPALAGNINTVIDTFGRKLDQQIDKAISKGVGT